VRFRGLSGTPDLHNHADLALVQGSKMGPPGLEPGTNRLLRGVAGDVREWREVALLGRFRASLRLSERRRSGRLGTDWALCEPFHLAGIVFRDEADALEARLLG
jgi:hypothetical protein